MFTKHFEKTYLLIASSCMTYGIHIQKWKLVENFLFELITLACGGINREVFMFVHNAPPSFFLSLFHHEIASVRFFSLLIVRFFIHNIGNLAKSPDLSRFKCKYQMFWFEKNLYFKSQFTGLSDIWIYSFLNTWNVQNCAKLNI